MTIRDVVNFFESHGHRLVEYSYDGDINESTDPLPEDTRIVLYVRSAAEYEAFQELMRDQAEAARQAQFASAG